VVSFTSAVVNNLSKKQTDTQAQEERQSTQEIPSGK
jgi:hypothetical protein